MMRCMMLLEGRSLVGLGRAVKRLWSILSELVGFFCDAQASTADIGGNIRGNIGCKASFVGGCRSRAHRNDYRAYHRTGRGAWLIAASWAIVRPLIGSRQSGAICRAGVSTKLRSAKAGWGMARGG